MLLTRRAHATLEAGEDGASFDPRLLNFEFASGFVLRPQQVTLSRLLVGEALTCHF